MEKPYLLEKIKERTEEFKTWKVENRVFKSRKGSVKKTVLVIGRNESIRFYIEKRKGKMMTVATEVVSGDTTKDALITFKRS